MSATSQDPTLFNDYDGFVEKFKPKKTTDDCYTPQNIYDAVLAYFSDRFGFDPACAVRPFWPGGDYESFDYPEGCVVVDNPPFSILAKIKAFYLSRGIPFVLFCPSLTALSGRTMIHRLHHVICGTSVTYENGAVVRTAFVTTFEPEVTAESCPELGDILKAIDAENQRKLHATLPKYEFPPEVITSAKLQWMAAHHTPLKIRREDCAKISTLDAMRACGKSGIFGGGLLLSERAAAERAAAERAAAERAAAERAAAERYQLSDSEREMVRMLG